MSVRTILYGEGTLLQRGDGATTEVFTTVAQRVSIEGPDRSVPSVDKTNLDSTSKRKRPGVIPDNGKLSLTVQFDTADTGHLAMESDVATPGAVPHWRLVFNNGAGAGSRPFRQFSGFVTAFKVTGMEDESNVTADVEIDIDGDISVGITG